MQYFEVSSKEGDGVEEAFLNLATLVNDKNKKQVSSQIGLGLNSNSMVSNGSMVLEIPTQNITLDNKQRVGMTPLDNGRRSSVGSK